MGSFSSRVWSSLLCPCGGTALPRPSSSSWRGCPPACTHQVLSMDQPTLGRAAGLVPVLNDRSQGAMWRRGNVGPGCVCLQWGAGWLLGRKLHSIHCNQKLRILPCAKNHSCTPLSPARAKDSGPPVLPFPFPLLQNRMLVELDGIVFPEALCSGSEKSHYQLHRRPCPQLYPSS